MRKAERQRLGILGGTFDPPHIGHLILAQSALEAFDLEAVLFVPAAIQPHKRRKKVSPGSSRLKMLKLALADDPRFRVSDMELKRSGVSYTRDSLKQLKKTYPQAELYLIIGGDNISEIATWKDPEMIFGLATVAAASRPYRKPRGRFLKRIKLFDMPQIEISSTLIRKLVRQGKSIRYLVDKQVEAFIKRHKLYK